MSMDTREIFVSEDVDISHVIFIEREKELDISNIEFSLDNLRKEDEDIDLSKFLDD